MNRIPAFAFVAITLLSLLAAGCVSPTPSPTPTPLPDGAIACTAEQKSADTCTLEYNPVCAGLSTGGTKTFPNACSACINVQTEYYVPKPCPGDGNPTPTPEAQYCKPEQRNAEVCPAIYGPVCGWFDPQHIQCFRYPCAQAYSNSCEACSNPNVAYWTGGNCPS